MTTNRGERNVAAPPQIVAKPSTVAVQESVERSEKVRSRTSISAIVTSVPTRQKSPAEAGPSNHVDLAQQDDHQGTHTLFDYSSVSYLSSAAASPQRNEQAEHESTLMQMAGRNSMGRRESAEVNVEEDEDGENGGRQTRRARKSVNYKEPSLHT
jgi:hypothetical protein